jgi:hypothetical protein
MAVGRTLFSLLANENDGGTVELLQRWTGAPDRPPGTRPGG